MNGHIEDQVAAYMSPDVLEALSERMSSEAKDVESSGRERAEIGNRALERYFYLLSKKRQELRDRFSENELGLMCDASNGTLWSVDTIAYLPHGIEDAISLDGLDAKWDVDGEALLAKLNELDLLSLCALVDGIELVWAGAYYRERLDFSRVLGKSS